MYTIALLQVQSVLLSKLRSEVCAPVCGLLLSEFRVQGYTPSKKLGKLPAVRRPVVCLEVYTLNGYKGFWV